MTRIIRLLATCASGAGIPFFMQESMSMGKIRDAHLLHRVRSDPQPEQYIFHQPMRLGQSVCTDPNKTGETGFVPPIPRLCYKPGILLWLLSCQHNVSSKEMSLSMGLGFRSPSCELKRTHNMYLLAEASGIAFNSGSSAIRSI